MKRIFYILLFSILTQAVSAQCGSRLVDIAAAQSGHDALFLREFKVRLSEAKRTNPCPVAKYPVILKNGVQYRFNVANASEFEGKAILQLIDKDKVLGSTYDIEKDFDYQQFDFTPEKSGTYQVLMSFRESKKGCAVGILSLVIDDHTKLSDVRLHEVIDSSRILYIGIDNELNIGASGIPKGTLEVSITDGMISGSSGNYVARVYKPGITTIKVVSKDSLGKVKEEATSDFRAIPLPLPEPCFQGFKGGYINKQVLLSFDYMELCSSTYLIDFKIKGFSFADRKNALNGRFSDSDKITVQQKQFIQKLNSGDIFYINNITIQSENGSKYELDAMEIIID